MNQVKVKFLLNQYVINMACFIFPNICVESSRCHDDCCAANIWQMYRTLNFILFKSGAQNLFYISISVLCMILV